MQNLVLTRAVEPELKILGSGSNSRCLHVLAPAPKQFGPLKTESRSIICTTCLPQNLEPKFHARAPASPSKSFWIHLWLQLQSSMILGK